MHNFSSRYMVSLQNNWFYFLIITRMCLCCQKSEWWAVRWTCFMNPFFPLIWKCCFSLLCLCCFYYESVKNKYSMLAENLNESVLELAYFHAESAVKHNSIERAEWGSLAGWLVPCHVATLPILPPCFLPASTLTNVYGDWDETARPLFIRGPLRIHRHSRRPLHSSSGWNQHF